MVTELLRSTKRLSLVTRVRPEWYVIATLTLVTLWAVNDLNTFNLYIYDAALFACVGAISLNLLMGTAGQVSVGNAAFLALGGYTTVWMTRSGVAFPIDVPIAALASAAVGLLVGLPAVRLRGLHLALATLAAYYIVIFFGDLYQSRVPEAQSAGFTLTTLFVNDGILGSERRWAWLMLSVVAVTVVGFSLLMRNRTGRAWRLIRDQETIAATVGIPVTSYKLAAFTFSSAVIGIEGSLLAHFTGAVSTETYTFVIAVQYLAMIFIGGLDSIVGSVIGAAIVTVLPAVMPNIVSALVASQEAAIRGPQVALIAYGLLIIIFITRAPRGIAGWIRSTGRWASGYLRRRLGAYQSSDALKLPSA